MKKEIAIMVLVLVLLSSICFNGYLYLVNTDLQDSLKKSINNTEMAVDCAVTNAFLMNSTLWYQREYLNRLDSMDLVAEEIFPIKNQTVVMTNEGYISANYDWENNTKISDGGWLIQVNNSEKGVTEYLFDGWELKKHE